MASSKSTLRGLDAHEKPPEGLRLLFKKLQKSSSSSLEKDPEILDLTSHQIDNDSRIRTVASLKVQNIRPVFHQFVKDSGIADFLHVSERAAVQRLDILEATDVPGLLIFPSLLTPTVQLVLLHKLLHRDLSNPIHQTNLHLHYQIPYAQPNGPDDAYATNASFFSMHPETIFTAKDPNVHRDMTLRTVLRKRLRWVTLGGQYDWTAKEYPSPPPPDFPSDLQKVLSALFPDINAQAAIVNFYSPGDVLGMHRDVSEECDSGLISISIGCDGLFAVGLETGDGLKSVTVRLRSGDVVCMTRQARSAWHGVPKVLAETCPEWLKDWPASGESTNSIECWRGWMSTKRLNVNIRQMYGD